MEVNNSSTPQIFATKLESDEKSKAVAMLRRALDEQRDLTLRLTNEQVFSFQGLSF